jgi:putative ABC transport system permease protein
MMFSYYFALGWRSLRFHWTLTALMVAIIGVGIASFVTTLTILLAMSSDPIPSKSEKLFAARVEYWDSAGDQSSGGDDAGLQDQLTYSSAIQLMVAHKATHQAAMYATSLTLTPESLLLRPMQVDARATYSDFFAMFKVPFRYGSAWNADDDADHANVVILSSALNDRLFRGRNSVGQTVTVDGKAYRVQGVIGVWQPVPRFYDLIGAKRFANPEDLFLPLTRAIEEHMSTTGDVACNGEVLPGWDGLLHSDCVWFQMWVELSDAVEVSDYCSYLHALVPQSPSGTVDTRQPSQLLNVREWLIHKHVVANDVRLLVLVSFSFLFVCLLNAMGLMLAKIIGRAGDISVRRALGANRNAIFMQYVVESGVVGIVGGLFGLMLTVLGLLATRFLMADEFQLVTRVSVATPIAAIAVSVLGTIAAGLYPTWRAIRVEPFLLLKEQ